jgi:hypothetical protein
MLVIHFADGGISGDETAIHHQRFDSEQEKECLDPHRPNENSATTQRIRSAPPIAQINPVVIWLRLLCFVLS